MRSLPLPSRDFTPGHDKPYVIARRTFKIQTGITGYSGHMPFALLTHDGWLTLYPGYRWNLGDWAFDDPAMEVASAVHDFFCEATNTGELPWRVRKESDKLFRELVRAYSRTWFGKTWAWVRWGLVRGYSGFNGVKRKFFSWLS